MTTEFLLYVLIGFAALLIVYLTFTLLQDLAFKIIDKKMRKKMEAYNALPLIKYNLKIVCNTCGHIHELKSELPKDVMPVISFIMKTDTISKDSIYSNDASELICKKCGKGFTFHAEEVK